MSRMRPQHIRLLSLGITAVGLVLVISGLAVVLYGRWQAAQEKERLLSQLANPAQVATEPIPLAVLPSSPAVPSGQGTPSAETIPLESLPAATPEGIGQSPVPAATPEPAPPTPDLSAHVDRPAETEPRSVLASRPPTPEPPAPPIWLRIPALGVDTPVVLARKVPVSGGPPGLYTWETVDNAAGYHEGTAYPGQPGNVVISGHNNIKGAVFRPLSLLGDPDVPFPYGIPVYITDARGRVFVYRFTAMRKVREAGASWAERVRNARFVAPTEEPVLTLITCWPVNGNTHRIIVRARFAGLLMGQPAPASAE